MDRYSSLGGRLAQGPRGRQWSRHFPALAIVVGGFLAACGSSTKPDDTQDPGPPVNLVANSTQTQNATVSANVGTRPSVKVTDADGIGVPNVQVVFAVTGGGGSVTGATVNTNASGVATVGSWTMGAAAGANTVTATSDGLTGSPVTFTANATVAVSNYSIKLDFIGGTTPEREEAFNEAKARWEAVVTGDLTDFLVNSTTAPNNDPDVCGTGVDINETVDDVLIQVVFDAIDGPGQVLGSAGPCIIRPNGAPAGRRLTIVGKMTFDTADVDSRIANGSFTDIVLHEMGHVLGIGSLWNQGGFNFVANFCTVSNNPAFTGAQAVAAYKGSNGGGSATTVPVEDDDSGQGGCNNGTYGSHWEEDVFRSELMTGFISGTVRPLSLTTIRSLADLGYTVDNSQADPFDISTQPTLRAGEIEPGLRIDLRGDVRQGPIYMLSEHPGGPMVRVR